MQRCADGFNSCVKGIMMGTACTNKQETRVIQNIYFIKARKINKTVIYYIIYYIHNSENREGYSNYIEQQKNLKWKYHQENLRRWHF
jgi:hypothetical protein